MTLATPPTSWRRESGPGGVRTLWFDSPGRSQNVLDLAAFDELDGCLAEVEDDPSLRGVLIRSGKPGGFCAGADLKTIQACQSAGELESYLRRGLAVLDRLAHLRVPTAAVLHGVCLGGGLELALACRCRVALASGIPLQLGCPEVRLGLIPAWGAITRLPRLLAPRDALDLLLTGNPIGFLQARSQGLVDRLVSQDEQDRIAETFDRDPCPERPFAADPWHQELDFARAKAEDQPTDFPEVQDVIMDVIRIDLARGPDAARDAAIVRCAELALRPATRQAIADFFKRRRSAS
jgi:enoyl-CoA hydratase/carnithine racemase